MISSVPFPADTPPIVAGLVAVHESAIGASRPSAANVGVKLTFFRVVGRGIAKDPTLAERVGEYSKFASQHDRQDASGDRRIGCVGRMH